MTPETQFPRYLNVQVENISNGGSLDLSSKHHQRFVMSVCLDNILTVTNVCCGQFDIQYAGNDTVTVECMDDPLAFRARRKIMHALDPENNPLESGE